MRWQQAKQGIPDMPQASSGSIPGSPPCWTCLESIQKKVPRMHLNETFDPPQLVLFIHKKQRVLLQAPFRCPSSSFLTRRFHLECGCGLQGLSCPGYVLAVSFLKWFDRIPPFTLSMKNQVQGKDATEGNMDAISGNLSCSQRCSLLVSVCFKRPLGQSVLQLDGYPCPRLPPVGCQMTFQQGFAFQLPLQWKFEHNPFRFCVQKIGVEDPTDRGLCQRTHYKDLFLQFIKQLRANEIFLQCS